MINAVNNFCVLAGARISSGFFSYKLSPVRASTIMTDLAPVAGTPPGRVAGGVSRVVLGRARGAFGFAFVFGLGFGSFSSSEGVGTPVGRTTCGVSVWAKTFVATTIAQRHKVESRPNFMGGQLPIEFPTVQA